MPKQVIVSYKTRETVTFLMCKLGEHSRCGIRSLIQRPGKLFVCDCKCHKIIPPEGGEGITI